MHLHAESLNALSLNCFGCGIIPFPRKKNIAEKTNFFIINALASGSAVRQASP
jgi:hypothetical protein